MSFLDEEDEAYEPEDDEDDADAAIDNAKERMTVKISKKELTELLWDSTRLGVPLLRAGSGDGVLNSTSSRMLYDRAGTITENILALMDASSSGNLPTGNSGDGGSELVDDADNPVSMAAFPPMLFPPPMMLHAPMSFLRSSEDMQPMQELHGKISQEQCIQLASQMHKHFQLLLQNYHLFARPEDEATEPDARTRKFANPDYELAEFEAAEADPATRKQRKQDALQACKEMMEELQSRGEKAQKCKDALLSKLNPSASTSNQESMGSRRVTRSLTAAHAAVAHPSMFELVGSNSLDELTSKFQESCSLEERNKTIQEQMLEIDKHLLLTKKKNPKKPFTHSEDNLLAHGVKRFHLYDDTWMQIERNFLPGKKIGVIRRRYRYLTSNKKGMSAVKEYHSQFPKRRDASWILEEDLRIARGMIEFHNDNKRFARVGLKYLPHRGRLEIRKRWERIRQKFQQEIAAQNATIDDSSIDFAVLMKDLLEDKLREQVMRQSKKIVEEPSQCKASPQGDAASKNNVHKGPGKESGSELPVEVKDEDAPASTRRDDGGSFCKTKNLHPSLFFTSWALINPSTLLSRTCEHNWPSFIDELSGEPKEDSTSATKSATSPDAGELSGDVQSAHSENLEEEDTDVSLSKANGSATDTSTRPARKSSKTNRTASPMASTSGRKGNAKSVDSESEPSTANTSALYEDEDEDDSDYEHDELVSSDDNGSDSEFEQMELSDDDEDDEDDDDDDFECEELDDGDDEDVPSLRVKPTSTRIKPARVAKSRAASREKKASPQPQPASLRHPLRLQNLSKPGNEQMKRALEALERRIVGKSVGTTSSVDAANRAATVPTNAKKNLARVSISNAPSVPGQKRAGSRNDPFSGDSQEIGFPKELALETDEVLESSSGDDSFEREELSSSAGEDYDADALDASEELEETGVDPTYVQDVQRDMEISDAWRPTKKIKLLRPCTRCRKSPCECPRNLRMQQLMRRIRPASVAGASSSRKV